MSCRHFVLTLTLFIAGLTISPLLQAQVHKLVPAKDGSGILGYKDTPIQPW